MEKRKTKAKGRQKVNKKSSKKVKREFSAGGIVYRKVQSSKSSPSQRLSRAGGKSQTLWLITKSTPSDLIPKSAWRLPKGWVDDRKGGKEPGPIASGERKATEKELRDAAVREVKEEAGIVAKIKNKIGTETYFLTLEEQKIMKFVTFYLMEYQKNAEEGFDEETEEIKFLPHDEARETLSYSGEKKILDKAKEKLEQGVQEKLI